MRYIANLIFTILIAASGFQSAIARAADSSDEGLSLTTVLTQGLTTRDQFKTDEQTYKKLDEQADRFIRFRVNQMSAKEKLVWIGDCFSKQSKESDPFCEYTIQQKARVLGIRPDPRTGSSKKGIRSAFEVALALKTRTWGMLNKYSERELINGTKKLGSLKDVEIIFSEGLRYAECLNPQVYSTLALKAEEYFPDPAAKQWSLQLYDRAVNCAKSEDEVTYKARYRLALLYIAEDRCVTAAPLLETVTKSEGEYESRALYWGYYCATKNEQNKVAENYKKNLTLKFPLSYHALLLDEGAIHELVRMTRTRDPKVLFRSKVKPELNGLITAIELLLTKKSDRLAREMLDYLSSEAEKSETRFRLYVAVLYHRMDETLENFKLLSSVFRDDPQMVSNTTLELFYPLRRFEIMMKYKDRLDPLLAASIIRQESAFKERAQSRVGAMGLMQLMPATARRMERVSRRELYDPHVNIRLGMKFYSKMVDRFGGDGELALAAYNAGPDKIDDWKKRYPSPNRILFMDLIPYKETREYVATIGRNYFWYISLYEPKLRGDSTGRGLAAAQPSMGLKRSANTNRPLFSFFKP